MDQYDQLSTESWAVAVERADPEDNGPLRLDSERIAAQRAWWAPSRAAEASSRMYGWADGVQHPAARLAAMWLVVGGAIPGLWLAWFCGWLFVLSAAPLVVPIVWWARSRRRSREVAEARHREFVEAVRHVQPGS